MEDHLDLNIGLKMGIREEAQSRRQHEYKQNEPEPQLQHPQHLQTQTQHSQSQTQNQARVQYSQVQQLPTPHPQIQAQQSHAQKLRGIAARRGDVEKGDVRDAVRLERSPHPYHRRHEEIPFGSERTERPPPSSQTKSFSPGAPPNARPRPSSSGAPKLPSPLRSIQNSDDEIYNGVRIRVDGSLNGYIESTNSDSGTEADDEHFLKGLPAPRLKPHKGLRGENGSMSSTPSPLLSPAILDDEIRWKENRRTRSALPTSKILTEDEQRKIVEKFRQRRRIEIIRRTTEAFLLCFVGVIIYRSQGVKEILYLWRNGMLLPISFSKSC